MNNQVKYSSTMCPPAMLWKFNVTRVTNGGVVRWLSGIGKVKHDPVQYFTCSPWTSYSIWCWASSNTLFPGAALSWVHSWQQCLSSKHLFSASHTVPSGDLLDWILGLHPCSALNDVILWHTELWWLSWSMTTGFLFSFYLSWKVQISFHSCGLVVYKCSNM